MSWGDTPYEEADVSLSAPPPPSSGGSRAAATTSPWRLASAVASLICGALSLLCLGAAVAGLLGVWYDYTGHLGVWLFVAGIASGVIGVVLGHLVRARRAAPHSGHAALATAGLVLSYAGMLLILAFYVVLVFVALHQMRI
jgi:hypothetical protein